MPSFIRFKADVHEIAHVGTRNLVSRQSCPLPFHADKHKYSVELFGCKLPVSVALMVFRSLLLLGTSCWCLRFLVENEGDIGNKILILRELLCQDLSKYQWHFLSIPVPPSLWQRKTGPSLLAARPRARSLRFSGPRPRTLMPSTSTSTSKNMSKAGSVILQHVLVH